MIRVVRPTDTNEGVVFFYISIGLKAEWPALFKMQSLLLNNKVHAGITIVVN